MKKVLVTGASGFVGVNLIQYFTASGIKTTSLSLRQECPESIPAGIDAVVHLAGKAHDVKKVSDPSSYFTINTELTKQVFDVFLKSDAAVFIFLSSVKATADTVHTVLKEDHISNPITIYGQSKLKAEQYLLSKKMPQGKRLFILRPCMIHGPENKGNLNLLFKIIDKGIPWPLGSFENKRSFCSVENLCFIIREIIVREEIASGIYNISDDDSLSTNEIIQLMAISKNKKAIIWEIPKKLIEKIVWIGDFLHLPLNSERLQKLTESYVVNNDKIKRAIGKTLPLSARDGLIKTFQSFNK